ncbi:hypothetical protein EYZ11_001753 [Aspergillus tanneri]|uniref:Uncharacterized protein n=1 Tax=Aspergillus tanneri TaxID=1220188 RepID=A0A4V3UQD7_9EURO|nr:hypothetical protein EYZ11_001753 [Aspergillus tanneri]
MTDSSQLPYPQTPHDYYSSFTGCPTIQNGFHDIDDETHFRIYLGQLQSSQTQNFILDFGNDDAWCAVNLNKNDIALLLRKPAITGHYGVSERLQGMMCTDPVERQKKETTSQPSENLPKSPSTNRLPHVSRMDDLEEAPGLKDVMDPEKIQTVASFRGLTFAHVVNQIWHFCSVDHGQRCTVVSIQENPFPGLYGPPPKELKVRPSHGSDPDQASIKQEDGPSLLFYYIFDDWISTYALVAKREHAYGVELDELRERMLKRPDVDLVNELHWLGRRLAVLKRLYQSYELIMMRILQRQRLLRDENRSHRPPLPITHMVGDHDMVDLRQLTLQSSLSLSSIPDTPVGVHLSSSAVARFERLLDRIKLYCLSEIDTCLTEKESLTFLNFNLIALKDSQAVEKLTRITVLLAKVTILFLPVSLMTGYFSTELKGVKHVYTTVEYWASFGVIMFLSIVMLTLFGYLSDTIEGKTIYQSLSRTFFRSSRERLSHRKEIPEHPGVRS